jgi:hypothetical protein
MQQILKLLIVISIVFIASFASAGSVTLTCDPPTHNTDGTLLTDLVGYRVYYGNASGDYSEAPLSFGTEPVFYIPDLIEGQIYYFAAIAFNTAEIESAFSNEIFLTIPFPTPDVPTNCREQ